MSPDVSSSVKIVVAVEVDVVRLMSILVVQIVVVWSKNYSLLVWL